MNPTTTLHPEVIAYVAAVRAQLDDLPEDVVEELTGGLEADLADLAAESDTPLFDRLGPAQAYAEELRTAAELPPRERPSNRPVGTARRNVVQAVRSHPRWPAVRDFGRAVEPAWWVARGAMLIVALQWYWGSLLGPGLGTLALTVAAVVLSVQVGRGGPVGGVWRRRGVRAANWSAGLVAVLLIGGWLTAADTFQAAPADASVSSGSAEGLQNSGVPVDNVFAYDAQGRPLKDVQLFDQSGRPLAIPYGPSIERPVANDELVYLDAVPAVDTFGRQLWNVFPHRYGVVDEGDPGATPSRVEDAVPPLVAVSPLAGSGSSSRPSSTRPGTATPPATGSATGSATPPATGSATPPATGSATPSATGRATGRATSP
jgi:hypothetical protein